MWSPALSKHLSKRALDGLITESCCDSHRIDISDDDIVNDKDYAQLKSVLHEESDSDM